MNMSNEKIIAEMKGKTYIFVDSGEQYKDGDVLDETECVAIRIEDVKEALDKARAEGREEGRHIQSKAREIWFKEGEQAQLAKKKEHVRKLKEEVLKFSDRAFIKKERIVKRMDEIFADCAEQASEGKE